MVGPCAISEDCRRWISTSILNARFGAKLCAGWLRATAFIFLTLLSRKAIPFGISKIFAPQSMGFVLAFARRRTSRLPASSFVISMPPRGFRYFEVSFTLGAHGVRLGDWDTPISALLDGLQLGRETYGVESRVIVDHGRSQPEEVAMRALTTALKYRGRGVIGFGLGGNEQWPPELFTRVFRSAVDGGLHSVQPAGEMSGPASIRGAIVHLKAQIRRLRLRSTALSIAGWLLRNRRARDQSR